MPIKGLTEKEETIVKEILKPYFSKYDFYFYGSRVKGNFRPLSDLDILMKSNSEINNVVMTDNLAAILYNDSIAIINF